MSEDAHASAASDATTSRQEPGSAFQKLPLRVIESAGFVALVRDGDFYLVQQASPAPAAPFAFYVPASEVRTATMQRVGSSLATPEPGGPRP